MKTEKERISEIYDSISKESIDARSEKFPAMVKEHGFEHVRTENSGSFVLKDLQTQKYFRVSGRNEFAEIEKP